MIFIWKTALFKRVLYLSLCLSVFPVYGASFKGEQFVVSGPSPHLVQIVKKIHKKGGNIFDMAVAGALSLSVTHPYYVSLACGGFAVLKNSGKIRALDFREVAPKETREAFYSENYKLSSLVGGAASGVPGFIAGLVSLHEAHGKLPWKTLVAPSIKLASSGFPVSKIWSQYTKKAHKKFNSSGKEFFFKKDGTPYKPRQKIKQPQLASALRLIQSQGKKSLYGGAIGKDIVETLKKEGGVMTVEDLKSYRERWLEPVSYPFEHYTIYSMPLPSSGGIILGRALGLVKKQLPNFKSPYSIEEFHLLGEILSRAFSPRISMGDIRFSEKLKKRWLSENSIDQINKTIDKHRVRSFQWKKEPKETTHFSIINNQDQAIAITLTLNGRYGSQVVTEKYGIVMNNQMDDFNTIPEKANLYGLIQGKKNSVTPGKRPLSSMTPTLIEKNGKVIMAIGGVGGPMIISSVFQSIYRYLVHKFSIDQAIQAPRIHHQFQPKTLFYEKSKMRPSLLTQLRKKGHTVKEIPYIGFVFGVVKNPDGSLEGAYDNRTEGATGGM